jgi:3-oxoacyl-(acyl-carrier-protein) synthase
MARTALSNNACRMPARLATKLAEHDAALDSVASDGLAAASVSEVVSANGAVSIVTPYTSLSVSGTKTYTLAAGTKIGQRKLIRVTTAASTPNWTVTGTFSLEGVAKTSCANSSGAVGQGVDLIWDGAAWVIVNVFGTVTIS